ncbi:MAG: CAP domain-containing protein [Flavobacteriaceae bacterium]
MKKPVFFLSLLCVFIFSLQAFSQQNLPEITQLIFEKTNRLRAEKGLPAFQPLDSLDRLAQYHSNNMVEKAFYSHVDPEGLTPVTRAEKLGIMAWRQKGNTFIGIAENIAQVPWFQNVSSCGNTRSSEALAQCMVEGWKNSPPHYKNIMGDYLYLGVGIQFDKAGIGYGTQVFR